MSAYSQTPAFPLPQGNPRLTGLTKREYFAAQALQGILANGGSPYAATEAVRFADELITQLSAGKKAGTQEAMSTSTQPEMPTSVVDKPESYDVT